jgi:hypothetical protein
VPGTLLERRGVKGGRHGWCVVCVVTGFEEA